MNDREKFLKNMALICDMNDRKISEPLTDLYWKILEPFTDEECENAFKKIIQTCRFFPKPVDFMEILKGKKQEQATIAWIEVLNAVKRIGNYESVKFTDLVIHSVINVMGGWPQLCTMESNEEKWKQKEFERLYEVISSRDGKHPEYLPGTQEQGNFTTGYEVKQEIVEIGFKNKTKLLQ